MPEYELTPHTPLAGSTPGALRINQRLLRPQALAMAQTHAREASFHPTTPCLRRCLVREGAQRERLGMRFLASRYRPSDAARLKDGTKWETRCPRGCLRDVRSLRRVLVRIRRSAGVASGEPAYLLGARVCVYVSVCMSVYVSRRWAASGRAKLAIEELTSHCLCATPVCQSGCDSGESRARVLGRMNDHGSSQYTRGPGHNRP